MPEHTARFLVLEPTPDGVDTVSEVFAQGQVMPHPAVAAGAEALGASTRMLALSLDEPRALRTPETGRRTLLGLHDLVLGAAAAVEAVERAIRYAQDTGEVSGSWDGAQALTVAAAELREVLPVLAWSAAGVGRLNYIGPRFGTETERTRSLVAELRRQGATVTFDPTAGADYHETDLGGGWLTQFTFPGGPRTYELVTGDIALDISPLPLEFGDREVHPEITVTYVLRHLDDFLADRVLDAAAGDSGWIPPAPRRR